jgi:hypothetical protein
VVQRWLLLQRLLDLVVPGVFLGRQSLVDRVAGMRRDGEDVGDVGFVFEMARDEWEVDDESCLLLVTETGSMLRDGCRLGEE